MVDQTLPLPVLIILEQGNQDTSNKANLQSLGNVLCCLLRSNNQIQNSEQDKKAKPSYSTHAQWENSTAALIQEKKNWPCFKAEIDL